MILVTVGNATQGFRRLLDAVDFQAREGALKGEDILFQSGHTSNFCPPIGRHIPFIPLEQYEQSVKEADLVISHAGAGTLIHLLRLGKIPVVMPRRKKYGEHVDDHQVELVEGLEALGRVIPAYEADHLGHAIEKARHTKQDPSLFGPGDGVDLVKRAIEELLNAP
jgi:UDP-N-acetylglucosamine transferase subunit ALG13